MEIKELEQQLERGSSDIGSMIKSKLKKRDIDNNNKESELVEPGNPSEYFKIFCCCR